MKQLTGLDPELYPFRPHWFASEDGLLHYIDEGKGQPVVFLHGNPDWSFSYRKVVKGLSKDYRCLALDQLGFGRSAKPLNASYHPKNQADRLASWMIHLGLQDCCLVVNDWGGPPAFAVAERYPDLISGLVIMNTWMWPLDSYPFFPLFSSLMSGKTGQFLTGYGNLFSKTLVWLAVYYKTQFSGIVHAHYQWPYQTPQERIAQYTMPYYLMAANNWFRELYTASAILANQSTALVWGLKDPAFRPVFLKEWQLVMPHDLVLELKKAGHFPQEDQPETVIKAIRTIVG